MTPAVSVIVVAYNAAPYVRRLLASLRAQTFRDFETIVVDNQSKDDTRAILASEFPEAELVAMDRNTGFAGGNNEGYRRARAPLVVLLNQDTWVPPEWLERLTAPLRQGVPGLMCTHSPILNEGDAYATSTATFDAGAQSLATLSLAGRNCRTPLPFDPSRIFYGSGAALAVLKEAAGERLFDEDYFAYGEDIAIGWTLRLKGGAIRLVPGAPVHHALPPEGRASNPELVYLWERNRLFNLYIHYSTRTRWLLHPVFAADLLALAAPKPALLGPDGVPVPAKAGAPGVGAADRRTRRRAVGRALLEAMAQNPRLRAKHAQVEKQRKVSDSVVTASMTARLTPFEEGLLGRLNRFSMAWCRAFGIVTVETAAGGAGANANP